MDDDELVVNLKKQDPDLKWPDIIESWESLTVGVMQLSKGTSIYLVGESSEINEKIARELAVGLGYYLLFFAFERKILSVGLFGLLDNIVDICIQVYFVFTHIWILLRYSMFSHSMSLYIFNT